LLVALASRSANPILRGSATVFVESIRGTPLLLQIYVLYFVVPAVLPRMGAALGPLASGLAALSINCAAYCAEIFRSGIDGIDKGQSEAARALGMNSRQTLRFVVLPQAFRRVLAPLTNEAVALLKDSSLVSVVALSELMRVGKELVTRNGSPSTVYLAVAVLYLVMTLPLTILSRVWERHLDTESKTR
jgi:His/Glu/Gln/Arg/opine family amino acid ABC transporter permease subunit